MTNTEFIKCRVKDINRESQDCVSVEFEVPEGQEHFYEFLPGQHLTVRKSINGEDVRRNYSLCTAPHERSLRIAIKEIPGGRFSTYANRNLKVGDKLELMPPLGHFEHVTNDQSGSLYVGFAAGSGITPIMSMLRSVLIDEKDSQFILFYGNRDKDSVIFHNELENLKNRYIERLSVHHIFSKEIQESDLFNGRINSEKTIAFAKYLFDPASISAYYLCGPAEMIAEVQSSLKQIGIDKSKIHYELFTPPGEDVAFTSSSVQPESFIPDSESRVSIKHEGMTRQFVMKYAGDSILDAAADQGINLPFACKGGVCATCRAKVVTGKVSMKKNYAIEEDELENGYILTCQAHPRTPELSIDFDQ